ncbi:uncharacterized protein LOC124806314 [Hydra vulgaris]|uniref:uncharacterized protein LOC124806314 n=1 Tax=Hydra vulgaris TaxID=6087 RepID=UPI001F5EA31A|nr:uncharacterized protein LOC124814836 [Hydra vulgaris]
MKHLLRLTVKDTFGNENLPPSNSRRFYPNTATIRSHIVKIKKKLRHSMIDQECLLIKCEEWKKCGPSVKVFLRPNCSGEDGGDKCSFLFVYQSQWQQHLLMRYGTEILLLDATYRTTRYSLPLFFLTVKTNFDYQIVASFVIECETKQAITEALHIIKDWNPSFQPSFCMTDYCTEEMDSLEAVFPGCRVLICDFHREQAWHRWIVKKTNNCSEFKDSIISMLRNIAWAQNEKMADEAIVKLKCSNFWLDNKFHKFKKYITNYWLQIKEKWIWGYRQDRFLVNLNTNNGIERQHESFKYSYLQRHKNSSITGMLTLLIEEFFADKFEKYSESNYKMDCRFKQYNSNVPEYLINRLHHFIKHCLAKQNLANNTDLNKVQMKDPGVFVVNSFSIANKNYLVNFGDEKNMPKCSCNDWFKSSYLCKHFFIIFRKYPLTWGWESISSLYRSSPFLNIDTFTNDFVLSKSNIIKCNHVNHNSFNLINDTICSTTTINPYKDSTRKRSSTASEVREMLATIKNLTFDFDESSEELSDLHETLSNVLKKLYQARKKEKGLPLSSGYGMHDYVHKKQKNIVDLPVVKKKLYSNRVGEKKEKLMVASIIKIESNFYEAPVQESIITEDQITGEETFQTNSFTNNYLGKSVLFERNYSLLSQEDFEDISKNRMLSDTVIKCFQDMLKKANPYANGLQDPILGQLLKFDVIGSLPFVQIIYNGDYHWLAISTYGCSYGEINVLDSNFHGCLSLETQKQICALLKYKKDEITVKVLSVQQQDGGIDCGLFSIAFIEFILSQNRYPIEDIWFDQTKLRNHALSCLINNLITPFPLTNSASRRCSPKEFKLKLYCSCRMIWIPSDRTICGRQMAQCYTCNHWFHKECEKINNISFENKDKFWKCQDCYNLTSTIH